MQTAPCFKVSGLKPSATCANVEKLLYRAKHRETLYVAQDHMSVTMRSSFVEREIDDTCRQSWLLWRRRAFRS